MASTPVRYGACTALVLFVTAAGTASAAAPPAAGPERKLDPPSRVVNRNFRAGVELGAAMAMTSGSDASLLIVPSPTATWQLRPAWGAQLHGTYAFAFGDVYPDAWWEVGARGLWQPFAYQWFTAGLGLGRATAPKYGAGSGGFGPAPADRGIRWEDVSPQVDVGFGVWTIDLDPFRLTPTVRAALQVTDANFRMGIGLLAEYGWGVITSE